MTPVKVTSAIILYFLARTAMSACEPYTGFKSKYSICWSETHTAFVSESCLKSKCDAVHSSLTKKLEVKKVGGKNPASVSCREKGQEVVLLKDAQGDEQSFCLFKDGSLIDVNAIERR